MALSLTGKTPGAPDFAYLWYLHSGGGTLAAGFPMAMGDGTETPLWISGAGIGFRNGAGFKSILATAATADATVTIGDGAGFLFPASASTGITGQSTTSGTSIAMTGLSIPMLPNKKYLVTGWVQLLSATAANGWRFGLRGGTGLNNGRVNIRGGGADGSFNLTSDIASANASPVAGEPFTLEINGYLETGTGTIAPLTGFIYSETAGTAITVVSHRIELRPLN